MPKRRLLLIEPHSDDGIISAGGFLEKYRHEYDFFFCLVVASDLPLHHSSSITREQRLSEFRAYVEHFEATWVVSRVGKEQLPLDMDSRLDTYPRRNLVALLEQAIDDVRPHVLMMSGPSFHHDHTAVYEASIAAIRPTARFCPEEVYVLENPTYVHTTNPMARFKPDTYVVLSQEELERKLSTFETCFPSQIRASDNYLSSEGIKSWARYRGIEARAQYAEALQTYFRTV